MSAHPLAQDAAQVQLELGANGRHWGPVLAPVSGARRVGLVAASSCKRPPWRRCCGRRSRCAALAACAALLVGGALLAFVLRGGGQAKYDAGRAVLFAKLAGAAYCSAAALEQWECGEKCIGGMQKPVKVCSGETTKAFVGLWQGHGLVAFEGTHTPLSMLQDLRTLKDTTPFERGCSGCSVHTGFIREWDSLRTCVEGALADVGGGRGSAIRITGHSLGGAVASLAMVALAADGWGVAEAYTFGMPRTGDAKFSTAFAGLFGGGSFHRMTHHMDPVPHVPPEDFGFIHVAPEVFYDGSGSDGAFVECEQPEDTHCSGRYWDIALDIFNVADHSDYMGVQTGSAGCKEPLVVAL